MTVLRPAVLILALSCLFAAAEDAALPVEIAATDAKIRYAGRFDTRDAKGPRCAWSACTAAVKFKGTAINVKLNEQGGNQYQVVVDGQPAKILVPKKGEGLYQLASELPGGEHLVELVKRTEANVGVTQILGFQLSAGGQLVEQPAPKRRIEVIGDSISCGYGNEGKSQNEHFTPATENAYMTYGAIAARALGAEYACVAWSGKKMWPDNAIPELYDRTLPGDKSSAWDFSKAPADAVLINLATNDFGKGIPDEKGWTSAYKEFIARIRKNNPKATIYCASGSMMSDNWPPKIKALSTLNGFLTSIVEDLKKGGDERVRTIFFDPQDQKNGLGSDWHPSVKTNEIMAARFVETLKKDLGW